MQINSKMKQIVDSFYHFAVWHPHIINSIQPVTVKPNRYHFSPWIEPVPNTDACYSMKISSVSANSLVISPSVTLFLLRKWPWFKGIREGLHCFYWGQRKWPWFKGIREVVDLPNLSILLPSIWEIYLGLLLPSI